MSCPCYYLQEQFSMLCSCMSARLPQQCAVLKPLPVRPNSTYHPCYKLCEITHVSIIVAESNSIMRRASYVWIVPCIQVWGCMQSKRKKHKDSPHPSKHCAGGLLHIVLPWMRNAAIFSPRNGGHTAASNNFQSGDGLCKIVVYLKSASGSTPWEHYTRNGLQRPVPSSQLPDLVRNAF